TRLELMAVLLALVLVCAVVWPALAGNRPRSDRVVCANNLRQIGGAFQLWGNDHNDLPPFEVAASDGGTLMHSLAPNAWLHFAWLSNELASPRLVFCPSDTGRPARDFTGDPGGGYLHPNFANRATSYFLSHNRTSRSTSLLAGDRNVRMESTASCSRFNYGLAATRPGGLVNVAWTNALHGVEGNGLGFDGRVQQLNTTELRKAVTQPFEDFASLHLITPR